MAELETLVQLQAIDSELDQRAARLEAIKAALGPTDEVRAARRTLEGTRARLAQGESRQRALEADVEDRSYKIKQLETKLFSGTIKVPKELTALQTEIQHMKETLGGVEEEALAAMGDVDDLRATAAAQSRELEGVEARWTASQADLRREQAESTAAVEALRAKRPPVVAAVSAPMVAKYDELRRIRRGLAVARVDRNTCLGCRTTLATMEVQSARQGKIAYCSSCGRILYAGR